MPKNTKSSASSATRKKQAAKAAKKAGVDPDAAKGQHKDKTLQRGEKKGKNKRTEPKKKVYIPPQKPKQNVIDPLDSLGLASLLPSELVILLRKASKKDVVTRTRALEGLWELISKLEDKGEDEEFPANRDSLIIALPSWAHLFPRLSVSPNRRLRQLTVQINNALFSDKAIRIELMEQTHLIEGMIGYMLVLAHGPDRLVSRLAKSHLEEFTTWQTGISDQILLQDYSETIESHLAMIIFHKGKLEEMSTSGTGTPIGSTRDAKNRDEINVEEDLEATDARLVYGALGALAWLVNTAKESGLRNFLIPVLTSPTLWSSLSQKASSGRSLGTLSPNVRVAGWLLLGEIVKEWPEVLDACLNDVGTQALSSAFLETDTLAATSMYDSLIKLVRARPDVWLFSDEEEEGEEEEEEEEDSSSSFDGEAAEDHPKENFNEHKTYPMFSYFNEWLQSGLRGITASYDVVIILLDSLPEVVFPPDAKHGNQFFINMYSPFGEGALEGRASQRAFLKAYLDCLVWLSGHAKVQRGVSAAKAIATNISLLWKDFFGSDDQDVDVGDCDRNLVTIGEKNFITDMGACLRKSSNIAQEVADPFLSLAFASLRKGVLSASVPTAVIISILNEATNPALANKTQLLSEIATQAQDLMITTCNVVASGEAITTGLPLLNLMMTEMPSSQNHDTRSAARLVFEKIVDENGSSDESHDQEAYAAFLGAYALLIPDKEERKTRWRTILQYIVSHDHIRWDALRAIARLVKEKNTDLEGVSAESFEMGILTHYRENLPLITRLVADHTPLISKQTSQEILRRAAASSHSEELNLIRDWLLSSTSNVQQLLKSKELSAIVPSIFRQGAIEKNTSALSIWSRLSDAPEAQNIAESILSSELVQMNYGINSVLDASKDLLSDSTNILPSVSSMAQYLSSSYGRIKHTALILVDPLVPFDMENSSIPVYDRDGYSLYCRCSIAILDLLEKQNMKSIWALPHLIALAIAAEDAEAQGGEGSSHFNTFVSTSTTHSIVKRSVTLSTSILSRFASQIDSEWFTSMERILQAEGKSRERIESLEDVFKQVWSTPNAHRIFARLLQGTLDFSGATESDASSFLRLGQACQQSRPEFANAIFFTTKEILLNTSLHDRLRNQLASNLAGVRSTDAESKGKTFLRSLVSLAPPLNSTTTFLPQQRCIFLLRAIQGWIASDQSEDFSMEMYTRLSQVFLHVLPVVQDMEGSHLDLIIDILELSLGDSRLEDDDGKTCLHFALQLFTLLSELAERSAILREAWTIRKDALYDHVRNIVLQHATSAQSTVEVSWPSHVFEEALVNAGYLLPPSIFKDDLKDLSEAMNKENLEAFSIFAYRVLVYNIDEKVKELVVEAALGPDGRPSQDTDSTSDILSKPQELQMPAYLLGSLHFTDQCSEFGFLLSWMAVLEYFEESSLELRTLFTSQIQGAKLVETQLLPYVLSKVDQNADASRFCFDEVFLNGTFQTISCNVVDLTRHSQRFNPSLMNRSQYWQYMFITAHWCISQT